MMGSDFMKRIHNEDAYPKPCKLLGFCPYGPIVEEYPFQEAAKIYAREHNMWVKFIVENELGQGRWEKCSKDDLEATEDLNHAVQFVDDPYSCSIFEHDCPVYYVAEGFVDEE